MRYSYCGIRLAIIADLPYVELKTAFVTRMIRRLVGIGKEWWRTTGMAIPRKARIMKAITVPALAARLRQAGQGRFVSWQGDSHAGDDRWLMVSRGAAIPATAPLIEGRRSFTRGHKFVLALVQVIEETMVDADPARDAGGLEKMTRVAQMYRRRAVLAAACALLPVWCTPAEPAGNDEQLVVALRAHAQPIAQAASDYDALLGSIGDARIVMLGEATHGSAEFYRERARLTRRLIIEKGFSALLLEAGWAPASPLDDYVKGRLPGREASQALQRFRRFPRWVWRNREFAAFLDEIKAINQTTPATRAQVSIHGIDLYGVPEAVADVVRYLRGRDAGEARQARRDYRCFAPYGRLYITRSPIDPQLYGRDLARGAMPSCRNSVARRLAAMERLHERERGAFSAMMSARALAGAEAYYRLVYAEGDPAAWNARERFLADTMQRLVERHGKVVVWAHNTHQGDARATDQASAGELSIGQLMREQYGGQTYLVGLTTYRGSVHAATGWATPDRRKVLLPAAAGSWSDLLQRTGIADFFLIFRGNGSLAERIDVMRLERAVGVTYLPKDELESHYSHSSPVRRFDALIHLNVTRAITPLP